jgi:hypothetical protein
MMMEHRERFGNPNRYPGNIPNPFGRGHRFGMGNDAHDLAQEGLFGDRFGEMMFRRGLEGGRLCDICGDIGHRARDCINAQR